jgi:hypothetical protein
MPVPEPRTPLRKFEPIFYGATVLPAMSPMTLARIATKYTWEDMRAGIYYCLETYVLVVFVKHEEKFRFAWSLEIQCSSSCA